MRLNKEFISRKSYIKEVNNDRLISLVRRVKDVVLKIVAITMLLMFIIGVGLLYHLIPLSVAVVTEIVTRMIIELRKKVIKMTYLYI